MGSNEILARRRFVANARFLPFWISVNLTAFTICFVDFKYSIFSSIFYLLFTQNLIGLFELFLMFVFMVNSIYDSYLYIWFVKFMPPIQLTHKEYILFGISEKEYGFKLKDVDQSVDSGGLKKSINYPLTPSFEMSSNSLLDKHPSLDSTNLSTRLFDTTVDSTHGKQWSRNMSDTSLKFNNSNSMLNTSNTSLNSSNTDLKFRKSNSFLLKRKTAISSESDLQRYLNAQNRREEEINELIRSQKQYNSNNENLSPVTPARNSPFSSPLKTNTSFNVTPKNSPQSKPFFSQLNSSLTNNNSPLHKSFVETNSPVPENPSLPSLPAYQPSIKVTSLPNSPEKSEALSNTRALEKLLSKLDTDDSHLNQMVGNIRKWISQTILSRLIDEINSINKSITDMGHIDSLIGETSIKQLKHLYTTKKSDFPTLDQVCSFLDIKVRNIENNITFQQYLVRRIKDLAKGGCMMEFLWDNGGSYNYKLWKDDMITDSEIILHLFCVYMDSRLLFNPTIPEGKPFTSQHFRAFKALPPKSDTYIHHEKPYPPYYSVVLQSEVFELPPGRNNLFYALITFLNHIKVKNFGLLGRINLKPSGLNIAWVLDK